MMERRVVITGMGIYSCIGKNIEEVKDSLFQGKSGIVFDEERKEFGFQSALTGKVEFVNLKKVLSRRQRIMLGEESVYAYVATIEPLKHADIDEDFMSRNEIGILYGTGSVSKSIIEATAIVTEK